jgi:hypothetical protein
VDIWKALRELYLEREKLDEAIVLLEAYKRTGAKKTARKVKQTAKKKAIS